MNTVIFACVHNAGRSQMAAVDLSGARPQRLTDELAAGARLLITMGCGDACPHVPGLERDDWPLEDPKNRPLDRVRQIRDDIRQRVLALLRQPGWSAVQPGEV